MAWNTVSPQFGKSTHIRQRPHFKVQNTWAHVWRVPEVLQKAYAPFKNTALGDMKPISSKGCRKIKAQVNISTHSIFTRKDVQVLTYYQG